MDAMNEKNRPWHYKVGHPFPTGVLPFSSSAMVAIPTILTLLGLATTAYSTALTTILTPNERLCFYADIDKAGEKIGVRPRYPYIVFVRL
jgi:hypothetical protein